MEAAACKTLNDLLEPFDDANARSSVKYYAAFSFYFPSSLPDSFVIPLQLDLGGIHFEVTAVDDERKSQRDLWRHRSVLHSSH